MTERAIAYLGGHDAVEYVQNVTGSSPRVGTNQGRATLTVILKPWKERDKKVEEVMRDVQREFHDYPEISAFTTRPPVVRASVRPVASSSSCRPVLEPSGMTWWRQWIHSGVMRRRLPNWPLSPRRCSRRFRSFTSMWTAIRRSCSESRCPIIFSTMKAYLGSVYVNDFNMFNRIYRVYIQADQEFRTNRDDINLFFVKTSSGSMVPLSALGKTAYTTGPGSITRF